MANTGNKQAVIAYKVRTTDGAPLDVNGKPTNVSGLRQAIALLRGTANPNPAAYVVQFYFDKNTDVTGNPTTEYDPDDCTAGFIYISPARLILTSLELSKNFNIVSSGGWFLDRVDPDILGAFTFEPVVGTLGVSEVRVSTLPALPDVQGYAYFKNDAGSEAAFYVIRTQDPSLWILASGTWNYSGFYFNASIWNF